MFPPAFGPRMGYLCKYLKINGWNPIVVTESIDDKTFQFLEKYAEVTSIQYYKKKGLARQIEWRAILFLDLFFDYKNKIFYKEALKQTEKHDFKLVLCSSYRTFPLPAARKLACRTGLPLIVDLRDIIEQYTGNEFITHKIPPLLGFEKLIINYFRHRNLKERNNTLGFAKAVTTVSPWHVSILKQYHRNVRLIYNGFDSEIFYPVDIKEDKFFITYTGRLISTEMRNPDLLFKALERLVSEEVIHSEQFKVRWFVDKKSEWLIKNEVMKYPVIKDFMDYYGYVPATEIPQVLNSSSLLLILTNKADEKGPKGVMTTKFFEYLAVGKPILCVRGDEGCLEKMINKTNSGLSAHNVDEVYEFIKQHFKNWKSNQPIVDISDKEEIKKFSREEQAKQFMEIFKQVINNE
jgi:glycosyltransferase involved in cell wall biosynthesis